MNLQDDYGGMLQMFIYELLNHYYMENLVVIANNKDRKANLSTIAMMKIMWRLKQSAYVEGIKNLCFNSKNLPDNHGYGAYVIIGEATDMKDLLNGVTLQRRVQNVPGSNICLYL